MKGLILAGGVGSRLYPATKVLSKQLLPVHDKPLIYYPLSTLLLSGIKDIAIITKPEDRSHFEQLLGDGQNLGITLTYLVQNEPKGIAECFIIAEEFIGEERVALILGDNIFYGVGLGSQLGSLDQTKGASIFAYQVHDAERYGVVEFDKDGRVISIEEKPSSPKSNYAIPGLYFFDNKVVKYAKALKPSARGELEITDLLEMYLLDKKLFCKLLERGTVWLDTGTWDSFADATNFVRILELRQGIKFGCIEEIAWRSKFISNENLKEVASKIPNESYKKYLLNLITDY